MEFVWGTKEISPEQVAWYRWYSEEKVADPEMVKQEMPWTAEMSFVTTGAQYFHSRDLTNSMRRILSEDPPRHLRIEIAQTMPDTQVIECPKRVANLFVYASPQERARYVLGADPAYGSSEYADAFCISVWRCWYDRIEQVAEYHTFDLQPYAFAWVMVYLAGMFSPCNWNLEITGPGAAVMGELDNLKRSRFTGEQQSKQVMKNFLNGMQEFFYSRFDSMSRNPVARGTQSTYKEKTRYMDLFKDYWTRGYAVVHSKPLLEEMRWVVREPGHAPAGSAHHHDDRVIAAALSVYAWHEKIRHRLHSMNVSWAAEQKVARGEQRPMAAYDALIQRRLQLLGIKPPLPR
jgi:hypothetical protein